jgi:hypothetical protein
MKHRFVISISLISLWLFLFMPYSVHAEIYKGIGPFDTMGDLKAKFPNAKFERTNPAWATESDAMYQVSGEGLSGTIIVKFDDSRPFWRDTLNYVIVEKKRREDPEILAKAAAIKETIDYSNLKSYSTDDLESTFLTDQNLANQSDERALTVSWVRWVPDSPIPLERFMTKYGKPDESGFSDENMQPYKTWKRGISTTLTDDGKRVLMVDYSFTREDRALAWSIMYPNSKYNPYIKKSKPKPQPSKKKK